MQSRGAVRRVDPAENPEHDAGGESAEEERRGGLRGERHEPPRDRDAEDAEPAPRRAAPPITPRRALSISTSRVTSQRDQPFAFRIPNSGTRSVTLISIVFRTPIAPTKTAIELTTSRKTSRLRSIAPNSVCHSVVDRQSTFFGSFANSASIAFSIRASSAGSRLTAST